ncbi:MAG: site-specific DNA-methyltransferase [Acidimicrobiales bacterium]
MAAPASTAGHEPPRRVRRPTATARFGSSRRESHDASAFYDRFVPPELSSATTVTRPDEVDVVFEHDARDMSKVPSSSIALVVTSPPYFAGKAYEESLGENGVPGSYFEYLALLRDVFDECKRVLEPGGRIAVNVANLGRRPYRSLAGDVTEILQDLGLLLRGEVVWWKGRAAGGSCAWGTFQRPANPVLRDVTERIVIASKGRFDRALKPAQRHELGLPSTTTISRDEFLEATTDLWDIPPESATRVGHPAPFPVALPKRLIELYTYEGDVVLDPFMGSGSTAVAAVRTGRRYVGFETDRSYIDRSNERVDAEREGLQHHEPPASTPFRVHLPAVPPADDGEDVRGRAVREGRQAKDLAGILLTSCGFEHIRTDVRQAGLGIELDFVATDQLGQDWAFDVSGAFTASRAGLRRTDSLWKALGKASVLHQSGRELPLVLLTTDAPARGTAGAAALDVVMGPGRPVFDLVELLDTADQERLRDHAHRGRPDR